MFKNKSHVILYFAFSGHENMWKAIRFTNDPTQTYIYLLFTYSCCVHTTPPWHSCLPTYYLPLRLWLLGAIIIIILFFLYLFPFPLYSSISEIFIYFFPFLPLFFCCCCCVHSHNNLSDSVGARKHNMKRMKLEVEKKWLCFTFFRDVLPWSSLHFLIYSVGSSSCAMMMTMKVL